MYLESRQLRLYDLPQIPAPPIPLSTLNAAIIVCSVFLFLSVLAVILRFVARTSIGIIARDDWFTLASLACYITYCAGVITDEIYGYDKKYVSGHELYRLTWIFVANEGLYIWTMVFLKLALGFFFLRLVTVKWQRWLIYGVMTVSTLHGFGYFWVSVFQCGVPGHLWWEKRYTGKCVGASYIYGWGYSQVAISAGGDIIMCLLPIPMVRKAKINPKEKAIVIGIILMAAVGCVASIYRARFNSGLIRNDLVFWDSVQGIAIWSAIEPGLGLIASSLATMRPLIRKSIRMFKDVTSTIKSKSSKNRSGKYVDRVDRAQNISEETGDTVDTDKTRVTTRQNFLLSATRGTMNGKDEDEEFDIKFSTGGFNRTLPLDTMNNAEKGEYYGLAPPPPVYQERSGNHRSLSYLESNITAPELPEILTSSNWRGTWWSNFQRRSGLRSTRTASVTDLATRTSLDNAATPTHTWTYSGSDTADPMPQQPIQEDGYRRWVIRRP